MCFSHNSWFRYVYLKIVLLENVSKTAKNGNRLKMWYEKSIHIKENK